MKNILIAVSFLALAACKSTPPKSAAPPAPVLPNSLAEAVASPYRTAPNPERDKYRHPVETLEFFGIKPNMNVVEVNPGRGWYMEILAPYLAAQGSYTAAANKPTSDYVAKMVEATNAWIAARPELKIKQTELNPPADIAAPGSADLVLTFRNLHNWEANGVAPAAFTSFYNALKSGGVLGVVEHRANPKSKRDPKAKSGYMREADVIAMAKKAGFKLDAKSEINANPKDTRNHPEGVWTLPPSLKLGDQDRDKYLAIGESDRMTLRFVKP